MKKHILTLLLLISASVYSIAQKDKITLRGVLFDSNTKESLSFASVYVKGTSIGTTSNLEGRFVFHIPKEFEKNGIVISMIGYKALDKEISSFKDNENIYLEENVMQLDEVVFTDSKQLTAKQILKKAYKAISTNYPTEPYILEGFIRDVQNEDSTYVEFLECATKMYYQSNDVKREPQVELVELRQSYISNKHPWNDEWDRKNSIVDLIEDDFIRFNYGPIKGSKRWDYEIESVLPFGDKLVYKIKATDEPFSTAQLFIDVDSYAFVKIDLTRSTYQGRNYKEKLSNGQQEVFYNIIFEYQEYNGKWYLKYQKEEDVWKIFEDSESDQLLFTKYPKKELFINKIITESVDSYPFVNNLNRTVSIENQAKPYNPSFWEYYNSPAQTKEISKIESYLKEAQVGMKK